MTTAKHLLIDGLVQGVFFRANTADQANSLGLDGWVRNLPDGRVEVWVQGEEEVVADLVRWCHGGPRLARVESVEAETKEADPKLAGQGFKVRHW